MKEEILITILIFVGLSFVNVITSTVKSILTIKSTPFVAGVVSALSYTVNAVVIKFTDRVDIITIIITAFLANLLGVWITRLVLDKIEKQKLWVYNATVRGTELGVRNIRESMKSQHNIHSTYEEISKDNLYSMRFFAYTKEQSKIIRSKLENIDAKYYIVEAR